MKNESYETPKAQRRASRGAINFTGPVNESGLRSDEILAANLTAQRQRDMSNAILMALAEERERRRIARGLHDDIGQALVLVLGKLTALSASEGASERAREIDEIAALVLPTIKATRTLTFDLASPALYALGLEPALRDLGDHLQEHLGVEFHFRAETDSRCAPEQETLVILHRCVRELVRNIAEHARADRVDLHLSMRAEAIEISVADNGVGFDLAPWEVAALRGESYGLSSVREQVHCLGGCFKVVASPGRGTKIVMEVPVRPKISARDPHGDGARTRT